MRRLTNQEIGELADLLKAVFKTRNRFADFLQYRLDREYVDFETRDDTVPVVIANAVREANAMLWWGDLLREARNLVPGDAGLAQFAVQFGLSPNLVSSSGAVSVPLQGPQLQLKIKESQSTYDILQWRNRLGEIEGQVCRIEYPNTFAWGTGFLIGPNAVMTNYHVIEKIRNGAYAPADVRLRFDYKVLDDGVAVGKGLVFRLASDWLFDSSPYSPEDSKVAPADPNSDELDYAILRVQGTPGNDPVGGKTQTADPHAIPRGWVEPAAAPHDFLAQRALYIVQHPDGKPMQVAIDSNAVVGVNGNGTRVRYTTTTQPGSSGSPCFGPDWAWVAIHHSGDPKYLEGLPPQFNQGIPLAAIQKLLQKRNKQTVFGGMI